MKKCGETGSQLIRTLQSGHVSHKVEEGTPLLLCCFFKEVPVEWLWVLVILI